MSYSLEQLIVLQWEITPVKFRTPSSFAELAKQLGVHEQTIYHWKRQPGWDEAKAKAVWLRLKKKMPDIVNALIEDLTSPDGWQARRDFIRYGLPHLGKLDENNYFAELEQADASMLPQSTIQSELALLPPDERQRFIDILSRLGNLQAEPQVIVDYRPAYEVERTQEMSDITTATTVEGQVSSPSPTPTAQRTGPARYNPNRGNRKRRPNSPR